MKCEEVFNEDCEVLEFEVFIYDCVMVLEVEDVLVVLEKVGFFLVELEFWLEEKEMIIFEENLVFGELEYRGLLGVEKF